MDWFSEHRNRFPRTESLRRFPPLNSSVLLFACSARSNFSSMLFAAASGSDLPADPPARGFELSLCVCPEPVSANDRFASETGAKERFVLCSHP